MINIYPLFYFSYFTLTLNPTTNNFFINMYKDLYLDLAPQITIYIYIIHIFAIYSKPTNNMIIYQLVFYINIHNSHINNHHFSTQIPTSNMPLNMIFSVNSFAGVTILLSLTVFLNLVAETLPQVSDAIPLLGRWSNTHLIHTHSHINIPPTFHSKPSDKNYTLNIRIYKTR